MNQSSRSAAKTTFRAYYGALTKYKTLMSLSLLNNVGAVLMGVGVPYFASKVFAGLAQNSPHIERDVIILAIISAGGVIGNRIGFGKLMLLQARVMSDLHGKVFQRLLARSIGYHANHISGKIISDAIDFVTAFSALHMAVLNTGLSFLAILFVGVIAVFISSWQLGLFLFVILAITLIWAYIESERRSQLRTKRLVATKNLTAHLSDSIVNIQTVKTFAGEQREKQTNKKLRILLKNLREKDWVRASNSGNNRIAVLLVLQFGMILFVMHLVKKDPATLATGIFAFSYTFTLTNRLFELNALTRQIEDAFLDASPMAKMLAEEIEIVDVPNAKELVVQNGEVRFEHVSFAYSDSNNKQHVFKDFNAVITSGEKVGLVGPSGGGKSTLTRLLLRFDDIQSGNILIDEQDVTKVTQTSLRSAVAYVPQEPLLFHRSIAENIAYGKPGATQTEIVAAAKQANAHVFISKLANGYETIVGERGIKLSGGQRQRIAIARAILKDAPILVLDEATSALDSENEQEVQTALWKLMKNRTVIVIAHRLSTIQRMDRIIVLVDGKITEEGPHKKLLGADGVYAKLWKHQSGGFIEE